MWRLRTGSLARPVKTGGSSPRRCWRGPWVRSGPSPRAGTTGRRRAVLPRWQAEGRHRSLPTLASAPQGRLAEGRALLEEEISESLSTGARQLPFWVALLSEVCRLAGRGEEA